VGGDNSIYVQSFNANGSKNGSSVQLEATGNTTGDDNQPQITAVGTVGAYAVTWWGQDSAANGGDSSVYVQQFNADGTKLDIITAQSSEAGTAYLIKDGTTINLADLLNSTTADNLWNSVALPTANTEVIVSTAGLLSGSYHLYTTDLAGNLSAASTGAYIV
jgi:3',5'-cyclic AMP phosphodiesterase CpdA